MGHCARHGHSTELAQDWTIPYRYHDSHKSTLECALHSQWPTHRAHDYWVSLTPFRDLTVTVAVTNSNLRKTSDICYRDSHEIYSAMSICTIRSR